MPNGRRIGLDNPALSGRMRSHDRSVDGMRRMVTPVRRPIVDGFINLPSPKPATEKSVVLPRGKETTIKNIPRSFTKPALPRQSRSVVLARHTVQKKVKKRTRKGTNHRHLSATLLLLALLTFLSGSYVTYMGWKTNKQAAVQVEVLARATSDENSNEAISENEIVPDAIKNYEVAADLPRFIKIPRLEINSRVKRLGVDTKGILKSPSNIYDTGWYDGSAKPGEDGAVLINGHVAGPTKMGIFYRLSNLREGDTIEIERGDGESLTYKVVKIENVDHDKVDMAKVVTSIEPGKPGLNLITSTGRYDIRTNKYEQKVVVYAVQN